MSQDSQHSSDKEKAFNLYNTGELAHAKVLCQSLCSNNPQDAEIWCLLSAINGTLGLIDEAAQCGRRAVSLAPDYTLARFNLAVARMRLNDTDEAIADFREVIRQQPNHGMAYFLLGTCYDQQAGKVGEALACHEKACQLMGNPPKDLLTGLADLYERTGEIDRARQLVGMLLQSVPGDPKAGLIMARLEKRDGQLAAARSRLEQILKGEISPADRLRILGQLGHVLDQLGNYERAYDVFKKTQRLASEVSPEPVKTGIWYDRIHRNRAVTRPENISRWRKNPARDELQAPVFLVGFPRSGTTLTEQIITSHPGVVSSDERSLVHGLLPKLTTLSANQLGYPYNLNDLTGDQVTVLRSEYWLLAQHECGAEPTGKLFLDKLPLNIIELCLINRIFPEARILLLLRDPRDVCLSCFMQLFRSNDAMANFSDLESTARFYDATMGLWRHYEQVLDLNLFKLRYEDLVSDFETRAREMLAFLGLGWDDRVLEYYKNRKQGISTPSYQDTSKPIYSRAAGRWMNYKKHMEPLMAILQPYIENFGYL